ncbi:LexA family protein [Laribacter hongkongensis]|uniref:LexA family protein n=1 Tax=Laribacter hongkongensis TaxID=168471 RepID=UPI0005A02519|nr:XRE family transcriptional regulator [Laribacter hongkongensis]MCG9081136.1 XRE family transcriptional regulator [Laribacter hongkongensis]
MNEIGKRIAEARTSKGLNQSELARLVGVSPQAVQKWESGGAPKGARIQAVASALGTTVEYLLTGSSGGAPAKTVCPDCNVDPGPDIRGMVPLISWVQAGNWGEVVDNFAPNDAEEWLPCIRKMGPHAFALRVRGDSMERKYQDGDIIFVDPDVCPSNGRNVVVRMDDENTATFKHLVIDEAGNKFLKPLNPDWPGPKIMQINGNARICGVVVGKWVPE